MLKNKILPILVRLIVGYLVTGRNLVYDPNALSSINIFVLKKSNTYLSFVSDDLQYAFISARENGIMIVSLYDIVHPTIIGVVPGV